MTALERLWMGDAWEVWEAAEAAEAEEAAPPATAVTMGAIFFYLFIWE